MRSSQDEAPATRTFGFVLIIALGLIDGGVRAQSIPTPEPSTDIDMSTGANVGCEIMFGAKACGGSGGGGAPVPLNTVMYLAVAMSPNYATSMSWAPTNAVASKVAMAACIKRGGTACRVVYSGANVCASVAVDKVQKIVALTPLAGSSWNASGIAMSKCQSMGGHYCEIQATACSHGYVSPTPWSPPGQGDGSYQPPTSRRR